MFKEKSKEKLKKVIYYDKHGSCTFRETLTV